MVFYALLVFGQSFNTGLSNDQMQRYLPFILGN